MNQSFIISGMTCTGCQNFVKQKIESIDQVINAEVSLEKGIATINSRKTISVNILSKILGTKYSVQTDNNFKDNTGKTHGMKFKINPPNSEIKSKYMRLVFIEIFLSTFSISKLFSTLKLWLLS